MLFPFFCPSIFTWTPELVEKLEPLDSQLFDFSPKCVRIYTSDSKFGACTTKWKINSIIVALNPNSFTADENMYSGT